MKSSYPSGKCVYNEYFYEKQTQKNDVIKQYAETIAEQNNNSLCAACVEIQSQWLRLDLTNYERFGVTTLLF